MKFLLLLLGYREMNDKGQICKRDGKNAGDGRRKKLEVGNG